MAAAIATVLTLSASPAGAQGDLDCGDPGTSHNMQVGPDDPNGLDADDDGVGCEDASVFDSAPAPATTAPAPAPAPDAPAEDAPADDNVAQGPATADGSTLPRTGSTTTPLGLAGVGLVVLGAAAFIGRRYVYVPRHARGS